MKELELIQIGRTISTTSATPIICKASDNEHYYTKFYEGVEGPRELVNEYIGYRLAKLLKLPIPPAALLRITSEFDAYIGGKMVKIHPNNYAFGSQELTRVLALFDENFFRYCSNQNDLLPIIVFDHIIANSDREYNQANLLFRHRDKVIFIIDHGRIFEVGTLWNESTCEQRKNDLIELKDFSPKSLYGKIIDSINVKVYEKECRERFSKITYQDVKNIFDDIPNSWDCSPEERKSGLEYLWNRFMQYNDIIDEIVSVR